MPSRPPRPCAVTGCSRLVHSGSRCDEHRLPTLRDARQSSAQRGYDHRWREVRNRYIKDHPLCRDPHGLHLSQRIPATMVDHIIPKRQGGSDADSNLQSLCNRCHAHKTARDGSKGRGRQKV